MFPTDYAFVRFPYMVRLTPRVIISECRQGCKVWLEVLVLGGTEVRVPCKVLVRTTANGLVGWTQMIGPSHSELLHSKGL